MYTRLWLLLGTWLTADAALAASPPPTLFRNATIVVLPEGRVDPRRDVLVRNARIERIGAGGRIEAPAGSVIVNAHGRFLMPGLAEAHAHVPGPQQKEYAHDVLALYLLHGLTSIRGMLGDPWHLELREELARGEVFGPRLYTAGPSINGRSAPTPERGVEMVREQAAARFDFVKLHPGVTRETFDALVSAAKQSNITLQGHVSEAVGVRHALESRQHAIDHLDGYLQALAEPDCLRRIANVGFFGIGAVDCVQDARITDVVRLTLEAGTWMVPTQVLLEQWALPPEEAKVRRRPGARYLPPSVLAQWLERRKEFAGMEGLTEERAKRFIDVRRALILEMHAQGVPILLGSDAPQVFNVPGDSALQELALYVEIGLTPAAALSTGTVNIARFFGAAERFGQVREGFEADLLLLEGNPLQDVRAVRRLAGVMARGRWYPRKEVQARLNAIAGRMTQASDASKTSRTSRTSASGQT